jgi:uncharacterized protein (TIGR02453 family)
MNTDIKFNGFPKETVKFYNGLKKNNSKKWFETHREDYDNFVLNPAREFVTAMGEKLKKLAPGVHAEPKINKSIFKIHRDVRFSKDKTPFKTHLGLWFWDGVLPRMECPGFYFHLEPPNMMMGVGLYMFPKEHLDVYRQSITDDKNGTQLVRVVKKITAGDKYQLGGRRGKKVPRGFDPDHNRADYLLYQGLYVGFTEKIPDVFYTPKLVDYCLGHYKKMAPLHYWLYDMVERI